MTEKEKQEIVKTLWQAGIALVIIFLVGLPIRYALGYWPFGDK